MNPKELILCQLEHRETPSIPYELGYEEVVGKELDEHYGSSCWREKIINHIIRVSPFDTEQPQSIGDNHVRDIYGSEWRNDLRPMHLEKPGLLKSSFEGYLFPEIEQFLNEEKKKEIVLICQENQNKFIVAGFGFGLFERTWAMCGYENSLVYSIAEQDFYDELVERIFQLQMDFIDECLKLPVDGIMFSDDWGDQRGVIL